MLGAAGGGRIGKAGCAGLVEKRHALDLDKGVRLAVGVFMRPAGQIKAGIPESHFALHPVKGSPATLFDPFPGDQVGGLAVDVDDPSVLFHGDQIIQRFPCGIAGLLQPAMGTGDKQLPQAAGIFDVDGGFRAVHQTVRNKAIDPAQKAALGQIVIEFHGIIPRRRGRSASIARRHSWCDPPGGWGSRNRCGRSGSVRCCRQQHPGPWGGRGRRCRRGQGGGGW